jgi:hypothetical protein
LKDVDQKLLDTWLKLVSELNPNDILVGVHQMDLENPKLASFISELNLIVNMIEVSVFIVDPAKAEDNIRSLVLKSGEKIDALRICGKPALITQKLLSNIRGKIWEKKLGVGIIGFPEEELSEWSDPEEILKYVDYLVRHVPPSADFILHAVQADVKAFGRFGKPIFVQIDLTMARLKDETAPLLNLIAATHQTKASRILIEFEDPLIPPKIVEFLKTVLSPH